MPQPETLRTVARLVAETSALDPSQVHAEGKLAGYGIDSARVIDLVVSLEEAFDIHVSEVEMATAKPQTVSELTSFVEQLIAKKG
jgi:acyl carrier protein